MKKQRFKELDASVREGGAILRGEIAPARKIAVSAENKKKQRTEYPHIAKVDGVLGGEAVIEGTRIAVWRIVGYYYKVGMSVEDIFTE